MTKQAAILGALTALALYLCFVIVKPFLLAIVSATVLAVVFHPVHRWLRKRIRWPGAAALASTLFVLLCVLLPVAAAVAAGARELADLFAALRQRAPSGGVESSLDQALAWISARTGHDPAELRVRLLDELAQASGPLLGAGRSVLLGAGETLLQSVAAFVTLFFFFRDAGRIRDGIIASSPMLHDQTATLVSRVSDSILANMYGVVAVGAAQGVLAGLGIWFTGLPSPVLWGLLTAVLSLIPMFGAGLVWVPAVILLGVQGAWGKAAVMAAWGALVVSSADNVIRPWVVSGRAGMNPLLVFFALLGGMRAFGVLGIFLGPVIVSAAVTLLDFSLRPSEPVAYPKDSGRTAGR